MHIARVGLTENSRVDNQVSISPKILHEAFTHADPKSAKNIVKLSVFFTLLGSAPIKVEHKLLVKLTPGRYSQILFC